MFYSQFILAKKGPLGTIWIAAHLERKLKKNQVADTDIGDSVDSILFPDVPIALRLSSHLLLGVVRIYSRKVNYLFHDCSEALLKVKQAFRSTAVDLPPEESTAPYHSITLPETFDLDDFELPDSALLNGNSDDRHVSSREQITLQDTVDGTAYSTLQFGLDERFGDGDASQIGLDLDEELLLDNNLKLQHASVSFGDVHRGDSASDLTQMDINGAQLGCDEDRNNEASKELSELLCNDRGKQVVSDVQNVNRNDDSHRLAFNIQTPDLNEVFLPNDDIGGPSGAHNIDMDLTAADPPSPEFNKFSNFPSTPVPADFQELPVSNLHEISAQTGLHEISPQTGLKVDKLDKPISQEAECPDTTNDNLVISTSTNAELENGVQAVSSLTSIVGEPKSDSVAPQCSGGIVPSSPEFNKFANFPSTPVPADTQELPVSNLHEISPQTGLKVDKLDKPVSQEAECPDTTNDNLVISTSTNAELDNGVQAVSSPTSIVGEPKSDSVTPQCSGGIVPSSNPVNGVPCIHGDSKDAANHSNLVTDPKHSEVSQVLPSCILVPAEPAPDSLVPQFSDGTVDTPGFTGFESTLRTADTSHTRVVWNETNELPMSIDNGIPYQNSARLSNLDHGRIDETKSCQTNNFSTLSSDFHMRSCTSVFNQNNLTAPGNMLLQKTLEFSTKDQPCNLDTPMLDQGLHFSGSSVGLQAFPSHIATDTSLGAYQKSYDIYLGHPNCFSSSEFSEPERMLFAPSGNANLSSDLGKQTIEKGLIESDGSVDRISSLCGQKRRLVDNTPELQNGTSPNMSGILRKKQNNDYIIPKDDDLLASILVGRRTPALGIGPSPPLPKPPLKRPRLTQKAGLPKRRKVLLDDTMVLHADAIRQQLINTEDIRRMRRKAPCTGPEIWRIQKSSLEEEDIFRESIFTGIDEELNSLLTRRYDLVQNMHGQANGHHSSGEGIKEFEVSQSSLAVRGNDGREISLQSAVVTERIYSEIHGTSGGELIDAEGCKNAASIGVQEQLESPLEAPFDSKSVECGNDGLADAENNSMNKEFQTSHGIAEVNNNALNAPDIVSCEEFASADCAAVNDGTSIQVEDLSNAKAASITVEDMGVDVVNITNLDSPQEGQVGVAKDQSEGGSVSIFDGFMVEVGADFPKDSSIVIEHANSSIPDTGLVRREAVGDGEMPASEVTCGERPNLSSSLALPSTEGECVPSAVGENLSMNAEGGLDVESTPVELAATRESSDFCSEIDDIDTDFLNVDDDADYDEEEINDMPNTEEAQSLENSGWSSRTRGVARYLKNVFDQDSGRGRKSVAIDHLLAGKSRKEASRMFFETLVLKTRDYIHVEQENSFDCIIVKPRIKLLKTEF